MRLTLSTPSPSDEHDRLAWRLTAILLKLNQGARVIPDELAAEFGVHVRTIRRDLSERFAFLPLEKDGKGYRMEPAYLGKLTFADIERFAGLIRPIGTTRTRTVEWRKGGHVPRLRSGKLACVTSCRLMTVQWGPFATGMCVEGQ